MANKVLVTKLNGANVNDSVPMFNTFEFNVGNPDLVQSRSQSYQVSAVLKSGKSARTYTTDADKYFTRVSNPSSPYYIPLTDYSWNNTNAENFYSLVGNMKLFIENKYDIKSLKSYCRCQFNIEQINYCDLSDEIYIEYATGNLDNITNFPNCKKISLNNEGRSLGVVSDITGSLSNIITATDCEELLLAYNANITGQISQLGVLVNLKKLNLNGDTGIKGTIEDFVSAQIANGRASVSFENAIDCFVILSYFRFGNAMRNPGVHQWMTWESASKIAIYGGSSLENYTHVVAKGATQAEIAAWTAAGKTVNHFDDAD